MVSARDRTCLDMGRNLLMTPLILEAIRSTIAGLEGFLDLIRIAEVDTTVSIAFKPAAFIVSPDSVNNVRNLL